MIDIRIEDNILNNGIEQIPYRVFSPKTATKDWCVLWIQGWSTPMDAHRDGVERMVSASQLTFVTMDYAGHGLNKVAMEDATRKQQHEAIIAVFDEIKGMGYKEVVVIGVSWGGYMAALLVGDRPVHTAILRAPANYPDDEYELKYKNTLRSRDYAAYSKLKKSNKALSTSMAVKAVEAYDGYVYVFQHELDEVVPKKVPEMYFKAAKRSSYILVPKTKHSPKLMANPMQHFEYIEHLVVSILGAIKLQEQMSSE